MGVIFVILGIAFVVSLLLVVVLLVRSQRAFGGKRVVVCPVLKSPTAVEVDALRAAWTSLSGETDLKLSSCSHWPERKDCAQECLREIQSAPDGCLVRERLTRWYGRAACALCWKPFTEIQWFDHKPGLISSERKVLEWSDIAPEELPRVLATHRPVCFDCAVAETFRTRFPDRVIDDPRPAPGWRSRSRA